MGALLFKLTRNAQCAKQNGAQHRVKRCLGHSTAVAQQASTRRDVAGETMVETLVSMLIIVLVFGFLVNAVLAASRINDIARDEGTSVDMTNVTQGAPNSVEVRIEDATSGVILPAQADVRAQLYEVKDSEGQTRYVYYEYQTDDTP